MIGSSRVRCSWWSVSILASLASCGPGGSGTGTDAGPDAVGDAGGPALSAMVPAPATGPIVGTVVDQSTRQPIAGASLTVMGGPSASSNADGSFAFVVPLGRQRMVVHAPGYVDWSRDVASGSDAMEVHVRLEPAGQTVMMMPEGGTVSSGPSTITIPSGAFASPTPVTATWISLRHAGSINGPVLFREPALHVRHRVRGVVHVDVPVEPAVPVTLQVPVAAQTNPAKVSLFYLDPGSNTWGEQVHPTRVENGYAYFDLSHLCEVAETDDADEDPDTDEPTDEYPGGDPDMAGSDGPPTNASDGEITDNDDDGSIPVDATPLTPCEAVGCIEIMGNMAELTAPLSGGREFELPDGTLMRLENGAHVTVELSGPTPLFDLLYGKLRAIVTHSPDGSRSFEVQSSSATYGVRGTILTVSDFTCMGHPASSLEVEEGLVEATPVQSAPVNVSAGQTLLTCIDCDVAALQNGCDAGTDARVDSGRSGTCQSDGDCPTGMFCDSSGTCHVP